MGIIRAVTEAVRGGLADTWLEVVEPQPMSDTDVIVPGRRVTKGGKSQNTKGSENTISNGSIIHVYDNQMMILIDGGRIVDFTAEPGYFKVDNSAMPSLFMGNGIFNDIKETVKESFSRVAFGGITSQTQKVFYINLQEIKGLKFGTASPLNYFDAFYNAELFVRVHGEYSIKIRDPFKFYAEVIPRSAITNDETINYQTIGHQYMGEFVRSLSTAISKYSKDGNRVSFLTASSDELSTYMLECLDSVSLQDRGFEVQNVYVTISYDDQSKELINMRNKGAMLSDAAIQSGYVAANVAEGLKSAGSNANGAMAGFMGMGVGMNAGAGILGGYQNNPQVDEARRQQAQMRDQAMAQAQSAPQQTAAPAPAAEAPQSAAPAAGGDSWTCECGSVNTGKFCPECGAKKPEAPKKRFCTNCGTELSPNAKFCPECGTKQ